MVSVPQIGLRTGWATGATGPRPTEGRSDERPQAGPVARTWVRRAFDEAIAQRIARDAGDLRVARLLAARGVDSAEAAERFLSPRLEHLPHPFLMRDLERASHRLADAIYRREAICLYADYDVDGVTSASLLADFLGLHGLEPEIYIPRRLTEGYGLNAGAVDQIAASGARLLVTLDCGITAAEEITRANTLGVECIVVDHHRCPPVLPPAVATLNPHQPGCGYPDKVLAAVGVTFNLIIGARKVLRERGAYGLDRMEEPNLLRLCDLVALGTIADMVPLTGVNRVLTHFGLSVLRRADRPGIRALMEVSRVHPKRVDSADVGFRLGPRINAAGRLDDATIGVRLLLAEDIHAARPLAHALDEANGSRQRIEGEVYEDAVQQVDALVAAGGLPHAIVLGDPSWHPGVVGIVASKLVERYDRPTVLVGEGGRGSGRTARGVHLYDAMRDCERHLVKFGGHQAAAGLRMRLEHLEAFRTDLEARVQADPRFGEPTESLLDYDDELHPLQVGFDVFRALRRLEPFGNANPQPVFLLSGVRVRQASVVGQDHLKLRLEAERKLLTAIAFKRAELCDALAPGRAVDLAACLELNEYQGFESVELRVRDLKLPDSPSSTDA